MPMNEIFFLEHIYMSITMIELRSHPVNLKRIQKEDKHSAIS